MSPEGADRSAAEERIESRVELEIAGGPPLAVIERRATMDGVPEPFVFGVHPEYADHYGVAPDRFPARATSNDMFVSAVGACLMAVFGGALEGRGIEIGAENLRAEAVADIGPSARGPWIVRSIHVRLHLDVDETHHDAARRVHRFFHKECWLSQTLVGSECATSSELVLVGEEEARDA